MILSLFHVEGFHTCKDYSLIFPVPFCVYDKSVISLFFFFFNNIAELHIPTAS